jgi:hypothetical protein
MEPHLNLSTGSRGNRKPTRPDIPQPFDSSLKHRKLQSFSKSFESGSGASTKRVFLNLDDTSISMNLSRDNKENDMSNVIAVGDCIERLLDHERIRNVSIPSFITPGSSRNPSEVPTPRRVTEEDSSLSQRLPESLILEHIKALSTEIAKIGDKIRENEVTK